MGVIEQCYRVDVLPDLSLTKYASLDGNGVDGVLEKHMAFLRQWNRKGVLSGISIHLFYYYDGKDAAGINGVAERGSKLELLFMVRGEEESMHNVPQLVRASPVSEYFRFTPCSFEKFLSRYRLDQAAFPVCSALLKKEVFIRSSLDTSGEEQGYYTVPGWEMNEDGRLYNMLKLMESIDQRMLYRIDLYPTEQSENLRSALRRPMTLLRRRQYERTGATGQRDYEAETVLKSYQDLMDSIDESPHFSANVFVFGLDQENTAVVLDSAGAEALKKGSYEVACFQGRFLPNAFLEPAQNELHDRRKRLCGIQTRRGLILCREESREINLCCLPTLFTLEETAPFFRFPTLYEGETIQKRKETAPRAVSGKDTLFLGVDDNGYDVHFPLKNLAKHAFIAGVPGSGKTITMSHLTSTLWKKHKVPFLVLEPAKQEYRALANEPGMEDLYLFSPNADMSFPLHINPFEFPKGLMLAEHIRNLGAVFEGAFPLDNPMPFLLDTAIEAVYRELGWNPEMVYTDQTKLKFPTVSMLYRRLEKELKVTHYSDEIRGNLESALKVRIGSLLRREMGDVFDVPCSTIPPEKWLTIPAVIELESMGRGPANFLTLMTCTLIREALKANPYYAEQKPRHVIFIEEAHNLIGPEAEEVSGAEADPKQAATAFVVKMLAEVRALKEGIVIADQLPTVMAPEVLKNTGFKLGLRITSADDRSLLGSTMAANSMQLEEMASFLPGRALVSYEGLMKPFAIQTHKWRGPVGGRHCEQPDPEWCHTSCPHYQAGDCFPDESAWTEATTPRRDQELVEMMRGRAPYQEICRKSFMIETERFCREFRSLSDQVDSLSRYIQEMNQRDQQLQQEEQHLPDELMPGWDRDPKLAEDFLHKAENFEMKKQAFQEECRSSAQCKAVYPMIVDCIAFAGKVQQRKQHWKKLNIPGFLGTGINPTAEYPTEQICQGVQKIVQMQQTVVLMAQQLYTIYRFHLSEKEKKKLYNVLYFAAEKFGVKSIMPD